MNFQPPDNDDPRDDEQRIIDGERAAFEKEAAPYGFDLTRTKMPWCSEPWAEYGEESTGHRWGGWLARALTEPSAQVQGEIGLTPISELVQCECGDIYQKDSYGAGYMDAAGKCPNCDAADAAQVETLAPLRGELSDETIKSLVTKAVQSDELSWLGFEEDAEGRYTIPSLSRVHYGLVRIGYDAALAAPVPQSAAVTLDALYDAFGIGADARNLETLRINVVNAARRSRCLTAIENTFFTQQLEDEDGHYDECALGWGCEADVYVEQFREALAVLALAPGLSGWQEIASDADRIAAWLLTQVSGGYSLMNRLYNEPPNVADSVAAGAWIQAVTLHLHCLAANAAPKAPGLAPHQPQPEPQEAAEPPEPTRIDPEPVYALLRRSLKQLGEWQRKYGEHNPQWLPPAGDVRLAEDIDAMLNQSPA